MQRFLDIIYLPLAGIVETIKAFIFYLKSTTVLPKSLNVQIAFTSFVCSYR